MEYGQVVSRAWEITRREKKLWVLGFMTYLGVLGIGVFFLSGFFLQDPEAWDDFAGVLPCLALWIWMVFLVVSFYARGGLIAGVQQVEDEGRIGFRRALQVGRKRYRALSGIGCLAGLPAIGAMVGGALILLLSFPTPKGEARELTAWLALSGLACCGWLVFAWTIGLSQSYAERAAILEGMGSRDAVKRGWQMLKANKGPTAALLLIDLVLEGIVVALAFGALVLIDLSEGPIKGLGHADLAPWIVAPICGALITVVLAVLIGSVVRAFNSAMWTLAYREMIHQGDQAAAVVQPAEM